jgi:hypothetical protein
LRSAEAVGGLERFGSLEFGLALRDVGDNGGVDGGDVAPGCGRGFHYAGFDGAANEVFGGGDVFHAFGDGPAIGSGFEVPLGGGKIFGGIEDIFFGGFEIGESFVFLGRGEFLSARGEREGERADYRESDAAFSDHGEFPSLF